MKPRPQRKERYLAQPEELIITRESDTAIIQYKEKDVPTTHLTIGPQLHSMTDDDIVARFNDTLRAQAQAAASYRHVAIEVPLGSPQIKLLQPGNQLTLRGDVLRCDILDNEHGELSVGIDDFELTLKEFGRLLVTHAGWGMRIEIVPADSLPHRPTLAVREPNSS